MTHPEITPKDRLIAILVVVLAIAIVIGLEIYFFFVAG